MAGLLYIVSGSVRALVFYRRSVYKNKPAWKLYFGEIVTGIWILIIHYIYRIFLMNGFLGGRQGGEPHPPIGQLTGLIRTGRPVKFYMSQLIEPGTLSFIGLTIIMVGSTMLIVTSKKLRDKSRIVYTSLIISGTLIIAVSPFFKFHLYPYFEGAKEAGNIFSGALLGHLISDFSLFPYSGFVFYGVAIGIALARQECPKVIMRCLISLSGLWLLVGFVGMWSTGGVDFGLFHSHSLTALINRTFIRFSQLGMFLFLIWLGLFLFDFASEKRKRIAEKIFGVFEYFGILSLTVFCFEPLMAELVSVPFIIFVSGWTENILVVMVFSLLCLIAWTLFLNTWRKFRFVGSLEWIEKYTIKAMSGKRSTKLDLTDTGIS
jgi:hypothetical protein